MSYQLGDVVPLSVSIRDSDGALADAGQVDLTVTLPDGTTDVTTNISPTTTGVYDHDYATTQAGRHAVRWVATGANASAFTDAFDVAATDPAEFVSLADVKAHMNKTDTKDDAELAGFVTAACQMIVDRKGQVTPITVTEDVTVPCPRRQIVLGTSPVISVTSVTVLETGETIPAADVPTTDGWELDGGPGVLTHTRYFPAGTLRIVTRAGRTPIPANFRLAGLELASHLWKSSQLNAGASRPPVSGGDEVVVAGVAYALPLRVRELLGLGKLPNDGILVG